MSNFVLWNGYLINSDPTPRGELGWGAMVTILDTTNVPVVATGPIILEQNYAKHGEAYQAGIDAAIQGLSRGVLP